jgi:hypothetical protein
MHINKSDCYDYLLPVYGYQRRQLGETNVRPAVCAGCSTIIAAK